MFRAPIFGGTLPAASAILAAAGSAAVALGLGWFVFERYSDRIAYHL